MGLGSKFGRKITTPIVAISIIHMTPRVIFPFHVEHKCAVNCSSKYTLVSGASITRS